MGEKSYDVIVVGSGPGGYVAAIRAAQLGLRVACIEKEKTLGGTCLNIGCIPSKALLQSSEHYEKLLHEGRDHGIEVKGLQLNFGTMQKRKEDVVEGLVTGIAGLFKKNKVDWIKGTAKLTSPNTLQVDSDVYTAKNIILATGSEPSPLPFLPFDEKRVLSSTGALALRVVPKSMLVIGAGVIGVEMASVYRRLGSEVVIVELLDHICPGMDHELSKALLQTLKKQGITFHLGAKVISATVSSDHVKVEAEIGGKSESLKAEVALVAVGRRPYSKGLGLESAGIELTPRGFVPVDGNFMTKQAGIYAIGDLIEGALLAHRASEEGAAVAEVIAGKGPRVNYITIPSVIYTHPEVAGVGLTEDEAKKHGLQVMKGKCLFKANARARCSGDVEGFVKVIGDKATGKLLGLHIIGPSASEIIHEGVVALRKGASVEELATSCHAHPTLSEAVKEACLDALGHAIHF